MKTRFSLCLLGLVLALVPAKAQTPPAPSAPAPMDAAKVAEYQQRFQQGYELQKQGKLQEARTVYDGILAEQPDARRSLLEAGRISLKLQQYDKADAYLSRLNKLEPEFPEAIELLIQTNQALKHDVKVLLLVKQFRDLHDSGKIPAFSESLCFMRELMPLDNGDAIAVTQYFNYTTPPHTVWRAQLLDAQAKVKRQISLVYDPRATEELRKNPKTAQAEQFILLEDVIQNGQVTRVDAYFQMFSLPEYIKVRNTMLAVLSGQYKPVYSQDVPPVSQTPQ